jgi:hypothetical protein
MIIIIKTSLTFNWVVNKNCFFSFCDWWKANSRERENKWCFTFPINHDFIWRNSKRNKNNKDKDKSSTDSGVSADDGTNTQAKKCKTRKKMPDKVMVDWESKTPLILATTLDTELRRKKV